MADYVYKETFTTNYEDDLRMVLVGVSWLGLLSKPGLHYPLITQIVLISQPNMKIEMRIACVAYLSFDELHCCTELL